MTRALRPGGDWNGRLLGAVLFPVAWAVAWLCYPLLSRAPLLCPWKRLLDVDCPGCGLTRSLCAMARCHVAAAVELNWLALPLCGALLAISTISMVRLARASSAPPGAAGGAGTPPKA